MKVRAKLLLYYNKKRHKPGEVFELVEVKGHRRDLKTDKLVPITISPQEQFDPESMERLEEEDKKPASGARGRSRVVPSAQEVAEMDS